MIGLSEFLQPTRCLYIYVYYVGIYSCFDIQPTCRTSHWGPYMVQSLGFSVCRPLESVRVLCYIPLLRRGFPLPSSSSTTAQLQQPTSPSGAGAGTCHSEDTHSFVIGWSRFDTFTGYCTSVSRRRSVCRPPHHSVTAFLLWMSYLDFVSFESPKRLVRYSWIKQLLFYKFVIL